MSIAPELVAKLEAVKGLPSPPRVALLIIEASRDPDVSLGKVAEVVTTDPVISAKILRMANSAAYAMRGDCKTLRRALLTLGLDATLVIALSFSLVLSLRRDRAQGLDHEYFWRRSLLAATAASSLGRALQRLDGETLFLAALLQDIGMLALDKCEPGLYAAAGELQRNHNALAEFEIDRLDCDHADVGGWLLQRWGLPDVLVESVISSHDRRVFSDDEFARCVALSGPLADVWLDSDWSHSFRNLVTMAVDRLHLDDAQLGVVLDDLRERIPETEAMFEKDLMNWESGCLALEEARELVMELGVEAIAATTRYPGHSPANAPVTLLHERHRAEVDLALQIEFETAKENAGDAAVVLAHIDGLDSVDAAHGAETAAKLLRETALVMLSDSRARVIGQYAQNEIIVWLENCSADAAALAARRIQREFTTAKDKFSGDFGIEAEVVCGSAATDSGQTHTDLAAMMQAARAALAAARSELAANRGRQKPAQVS